jgi:hypothetical protein
VRSAADSFNAEERTVDGVPIQVEVIAMDGLTALGRWDRNEFGALPAGVTPDLTDAERAALANFPTAWIPDSRYLVELANAAYKERLGRDVFLTDGEYRARPIAISLFTWGIFTTAGPMCCKNRWARSTGRRSTTRLPPLGGWPELGGEAGWGFFKLVCANPSKNVGGLAAMIAAAGEYYGRTNISVEDVVNPEFQAWLSELMGAVTNISGGSAYTAEDFALFGYSVGDGGQLLESDLLQNMQGILTRWGEPLASSATPNMSPGSTSPSPSGWAQRPARCKRTPRWSFSAFCSDAGRTGRGAGLWSAPGQPRRSR